MQYLITGGAGFIGSEFVKLLVASGKNPLVVDNLSYAGDLIRLKEIKGKFRFLKCDICDKRRLVSVFKSGRPDIVVHFAAESHVDRSILGSDHFIRTNVAGTQTLLDVARTAGVAKFIHVSTDEVYGEIEEGEFFENTPFNPSSPYSASKAAADMLIRSYCRTFNFPAVIVRPSNNYGSWQYPEKFIPVVIYKALKDEKVPVYGKGLNVREWLYVSDCAKGILRVAEKGKMGEAYNLGSGTERRNIDVARRIVDLLCKSQSLIEFVADRPGHDTRYRLNSDKAKKELDWAIEIEFDRGLRRTVEWYARNIAWVESKVRRLRNYWTKVYK